MSAQGFPPVVSAFTDIPQYARLIENLVQEIHHVSVYSTDHRIAELGIKMDTEEGIHIGVDASVDNTDGFAIDIKPGIDHLIYVRVHPTFCKGENRKKIAEQILDLLKEKIAGKNPSPIPGISGNIS